MVLHSGFLRHRLDSLSPRSLRIPIGTRIGLFGDYAPPDWCHGEIVYGNLTAYLVLEVRHPFFERRPAWDTVVLLTLDRRLHTQASAGNYTGHQLLAIQRYGLDIPWDYEQTVHVYGIPDGITLSAEPLPLPEWHPHMVWLASHATAFMDTDTNPSELVSAIRQSVQRRQSKLRKYNLMNTLVLYGRLACEATDHTRAYLTSRNVPFVEIDIDTDHEANAFVLFVNSGLRTTPTIVLNEARLKTIITQPTDRELDMLLDKVELGDS